jgi:hypothetical protein
MIYNVESLYQKLNDSVYSLKEPVSAIEVHAPVIDQLFNNGYIITSEKSFYDRLHVTESLMKEFLPTIYLDQISLSLFQKGMEQMVSTKELSNTNYDFIKNNLIEPAFKAAFHRFDTFYFNRVGYVIIVYSATDPRNEFKVELYFIPEKVRPWMARGVSSNYRDCFKE